ncbi:hypothetical protein Droror1_Dr00025321, partial [Drosera rotundifolia]
MADEEDSSTSSAGEQSVDEELALMGRKFRKLFRKKNAMRGNTSKTREADKGDVCFNCGKTGHFAAQCRRPPKDSFAPKKKKDSKESFNRKEKGKAYAAKTWSDTSSDFEESERVSNAQLCCIASSDNGKK